jgi:hypothetical protein
MPKKRNFREITTIEINEAINSVVDFLGVKWVNKRLEKFSPENYGELKAKNQVHPIIEWLVIFQHAQKTKNEQSNPKIHKLVMLGRFIKHLRNKKGIEKYHGRFKSISEFYSSYYELETAFLLTTMGFDIEFVKENSKSQPDIKATINDFKFYVECKSEEPRTEEDIIVGKICLNWFKYMKSPKRNGNLSRSIFIDASDHKLEESQLRYSIDYCLNNKKVGAVDFDKEMVFFEELGLGRYPTSVFIHGRDCDEIDLVHPLRPYYWEQMTTFLSFKPGERPGYGSHFNSLNILRNSERDHANSTHHKINNSRKQLKKGEANIVFVNIDDGISNKQEIVEIKNSVVNFFRPDQNTRISGVVLYSSRKSEFRNSITHEFMLLENEYAEHRIPSEAIKSFEKLGSVI